MAYSRSLCERSPLFLIQKSVCHYENIIILPYIYECDPTMFVPRAGAPVNPSVKDLRLGDTVFDAIAYSSIVSCTIISVTAVLLSLHPLSKPKTNRVSYRIMIYALCGSVVYSTASVLANRVAGQTACRVAGSFAVVGLQISSLLFFCIGLNLQLVMIHGIDGTRLEKYYVWGSLSLATACGVLTYASKQLTYDVTQLVCYYYDSDPVRGLLWRSLWSYLTMAGELITFLSVVVYMIRVKAFSSGPDREATASSQRFSASRQYRKPLGPGQYRNVVLRIALYPLSALLTTGVIAIGSVAIPSQETQNRSGWIDINALRGAFQLRGIIYALVAAADPAITQGFSVLFRHYVYGQSAPNLSSNEVEMFAVRSVTTHHRSSVGGLERENFRNHSEGGLGAGPRCYESKSNIKLPKPAAVASRTDIQLDTSSSWTSFVGDGSESQIDSNVHVRLGHTCPQLRQL
ncbi:hypothetical protein L218DRAFT_747263 [Marasmius fiardii PR-910]|nr:hypothetical protein L218DRAFT_747263 [Marasmius fiardii PR-910]